MKIRHVLLGVAFVAAVVPGNGKGWFGFERATTPPSVASALAASPKAHTAWGGPESPPNQPSTPTTTAPPSTSPPPSTPTVEPAADPTPAVPVGPTTNTAEVSARAPAPPPAVVARLRPSGTIVYVAPNDANGAVAVRGVTEFGTPRVLLTTSTGNTVGEWVQVLLPNRPNGATGWIRSSTVDFATVDDRLTVDRAARTLTWERAGEVVGVVQAAVGAAGTPTPTGTYFVTDLLPYSAVGAISPTGQYGAWVVALNGYSEAFTTIDGRDARIAIHGTNQVGSLGTASSSGCVRIGAAPLETLARNVPLGTPVVVI